MQSQIGQRVPFVHPQHSSNTIEYGVIRYWSDATACFGVEQDMSCLLVSPLQIAHARRRLNREAYMRNRRSTETCRD